MKNKIVKNLWIDALRSGEYKQGKTYLNKGGRFCCLGVLCEVHLAQAKKNKKKPRIKKKFCPCADMEVYEYGNDLTSATSIVPAIRHWAGLTKAEVRWLINFNDNRNMSFTDIADFIEGMM